MSRRFVLAVAACFAILTSVGRAEDFGPRMLKYFPGKWEVKGEGLGTGATVEWKLVADGKAFAGPGMGFPGDPSFSLAGWEPKEKKWVHVWFRADGGHGRIEIVKFESGTYSGTIYVAQGDGKAASAEFRTKIVDQDHFEVAESSKDKTTVTYWQRIRK